MTTITITGNLVADPELRYLQNGTAVTNLRVAENIRKYNKQTEQFEDAGANFHNVTVWRAKGEAVANKLTKGSPVIITGELRQNTYENAQGEKRSTWDITADNIGALIIPPKNTNSGGGGWNNQQATQQNTNWNNQQPQTNNEPPF